MASFPGQHGTGPSLPNQVTGLTAQAVSSTEIDLNWMVIAGCTYDIYRDGLFVTNDAAPPFSDTGLAPASPHTYQVAARNANGAGLASLPASATTFPGQVTGLTATPASSTQINLAWGAQAGASSYGVYENAVHIVDIAGLSYPDSGLVPSTTYNFNVSARNASGEGPLSVTVQGTTLPAPSGGLKWAPGYYYGVAPGSSAADVVNAIAALAGTPFTGIHIFPNWAQLQSAQGNYSIGDSYFDTIVEAAASAGLKVAAQLVEREFGSGIPNSTGDGVLPTYLSTISGGGGGWHAWQGNPITFASISGTTGILAANFTSASGTYPLRFSNGVVKNATFTSGSKNVSWTGTVSGVTNSAGYGSTTWSGGLNLVAALDNSVIANEYGLMGSHFMARYDNNPTLEVFETSETAVGYPSWNSAAFNTNLYSFTQAWRSAGPKTNIRVNVNFINPGGPVTSFTSVYTGLAQPFKMIMGGPDPELPPTYRGTSSPALTRGITSNQIWANVAGTGTDWRAVTNVTWAGEYQVLGANQGFTVAQLIDYSRVYMKASHICCVWFNVDGNTSLGQTVAAINAVGGQVGNPTKPVGW